MDFSSRLGLYCLRNFQKLLEKRVSEMDLIQQKEWFDSAEFEQAYHSDAALGAFCGAQGTVFRLWSPTAEAVTLSLYAAGHGCEALRAVPMQRAERGVWVYDCAENLDGTYYDYVVTVDGESRRTADPYARACGLNGQRSLVLDLRRTDPAGWQRDKAPAHTPEQVIYELHVRDFSWDEAGGFDPADRGRYTALCRTGTTLNGDGLHPTGLDYMKRLGVTHIQLMPVYDYGSVDEARPGSGYNWGYDPVNYNVPEGSYSSDPAHGEVRIRELKQAVQALHENGFRVIMDVVYNHTYTVDSWLWRSAPWYYYRQDGTGAPSNGSGCSNDLASERSMCARYILESVLYWAEEYHMDGFRFDLMGLLDVPLMERIQKALDDRFGAGEKLIYGEPWAAAETYPRPGTALCHKGALPTLNPRIGAFCDATRDAVKGNLMGEDTVGFVNGGGLKAADLRRCVEGWATGRDAMFGAVSQTITYLSCHDDWTLWDRLVVTLDKARRFEALTPEVLRANRLAAAINFCCQGRPFLLAGEEFGRTKNGVKNSFCSPAALNRIDWARAWAARDMVDYYRGLIALRMELPCLQDKTAAAAKRVLSAADLADDCAAVCLDNPDGRRWDRVLAVFNAGQTPSTLRLPEGEWQVLADETSAFCWKKPMTLTGTACAAPMGALLLGRVR